MLEDLKQAVYEANMELFNSGLVIQTWGNVSARTGNNLIIIKPSGVPYEEMKPEDMVVLDISGNIVEGQYNPSSDTPTHLELYKAFLGIHGVCHTHSVYASSFAQAGLCIKVFGTTHADYFYGEVPCSRSLTKEEVEDNYEKNTGKVITEEFIDRDYKAVPGVLVRNHGVFTWGNDPVSAVLTAEALEEIAKMNYITLQINPRMNSIPEYILEKHHMRKHGKNAYYGQKRAVHA